MASVEVRFAYVIPLTYADYLVVKVCTPLGIASISAGPNFLPR